MQILRLLKTQWVQQHHLLQRKAFFHPPFYPVLVVIVNAQGQMLTYGTLCVHASWSGPMGSSRLAAHTSNSKCRVHLSIVPTQSHNWPSMLHTKQLLPSSLPIGNPKTLFIIGKTSTLSKLDTHYKDSSPRQAIIVHWSCTYTQVIAPTNHSYYPKVMYIIHTQSWGRMFDSSIGKDKSWKVTTNEARDPREGMVHLPYTTFTHWVLFVGHLRLSHRYKKME